MHRQIFTAIATLPLLLGGSNAAQRWTIDPGQPAGIPSEDFSSGGYLGVDIADITAERLGALKLKEEKGVEVTMVDQDAPAGKAGIKEHDVILSMNGTAVESKSQLHRMIHETPAGRVITLGVSRDGQPIAIKVQLADRNREFGGDWKDDTGKKKNFFFEMPEVPNLPEIDLPSMGVVYVHSSMRSGMMVENLTPQLGEFFGAKSGNGVLVRSVEKGSRAEKAGLHAGDVVVKVGDQPIHDSSDFTHALRGHKSGSVRVGVIRDRKEQTFTLSLPEEKDSGEVIEESRDAPELDAKTKAELNQLQIEIAKLRPQMELAKEEALRSAEQMQGSLRERQRAAKEAAEEVEKELTPEIQKQLERSGRELRREMERLRSEMQGDGFDI
jgi:membrane-associated protease RseP (regulator of RpoE activity)